MKGCRGWTARRLSRASRGRCAQIFHRDGGKSSKSDPEQETADSVRVPRTVTGAPARAVSTISGDPRPAGRSPQRVVLGVPAGGLRGQPLGQVTLVASGAGGQLGIEAFDRVARMFVDTGNLLRVITPRATRGHGLVFAGRARDALADTAEAVSWPGATRTARPTRCGTRAKRSAPAAEPPTPSGAADRATRGGHLASRAQLASLQPSP